jgi:hypothetical protein
MVELYHLPSHVQFRGLVEQFLCDQSIFAKISGSGTEPELALAHGAI